MKMLRSAIAGVLMFGSVAHADGLQAPRGDVVVVVTGKISNTNQDGAAAFDLAMLENLPGLSKTLETPWTEQATTFSGPRLQALLDAVGAQGSKLLVKALNDYSAEIPMKDATDFETILAAKMDGDYMSVRDKGPLFLIYPFDTHPELFNEKYFARSVWQISEIEVVE